MSLVKGESHKEVSEGESKDGRQLNSFMPILTLLFPSKNPTRGHSSHYLPFLLIQLLHGGATTYLLSLTLTGSSELLGHLSHVLSFHSSPTALRELHHSLRIVYPITPLSLSVDDCIFLLHSENREH